MSKAREREDRLVARATTHYRYRIVELVAENNDLTNEIRRLREAIRDDNGIESLRILLNWLDPMRPSDKPQASMGRVTDRIERVRTWIDGLARALTEGENDE